MSGRLEWLCEANAEFDLRSEEEIKLAHQSLADFMFPRANKWGCSTCGEEQVHRVTCRANQSSKYYATSVMKYKAVHGNCCKLGCARPAVLRIRLNVWGGLYEFDVCREHGTHPDGSSRDGNWCDGL